MSGLGSRKRSRKRRERLPSCQRARVARRASGFPASESSVTGLQDSARASPTSLSGYIATVQVRQFASLLTIYIPFLFSGPRMRRRDPCPPRREAQAGQADASCPTMQVASVQAQVLDRPGRRAKLCPPDGLHPRVVRLSPPSARCGWPDSQGQPQARRGDQGPLEGGPQTCQAGRRGPDGPPYGQEEAEGRNGAAAHHCWRRQGRQGQDRQARRRRCGKEEARRWAQGQEEQGQEFGSGGEAEREEGLSRGDVVFILMRSPLCDAYLILKHQQLPRLARR